MGERHLHQRAVELSIEAKATCGCRIGSFHRLSELHQSSGNADELGSVTWGGCDGKDSAVWAKRNVLLAASSNVIARERHKCLLHTREASETAFA